MFRLKITLLIDITDDLSDAAAKESVRSKVEAAVCMFPIVHFWIYLIISCIAGASSSSLLHNLK